jgi:hypothetical protein
MAVQHLQRLEVAWQWLRWAYLALDLATVATGLYLDSKLRSLPPLTSVDPSALSYYVRAVAVSSSGRVVAYLLALAGFIGATHVIGRWRGSPSTKLLLSLARRLGDVEGQGTNGVAASFP